MILTTHALTGAVIGKNVSNPWIVVILSLVVHYLMDGIRHAEYFDDRYAKIKDTWWKVALDLLIGTSFISAYIYFTDPGFEALRNIIIGAFFLFFLTASPCFIIFPAEDILRVSKISTP